MRVRKVRGRPFKPGNPGRPPGSRNKITQMLEQLAEGEAEQLLQKVLELARAGDVSCLKMLLDRVWPVRKGQPVNIGIPPIRTSEDVLQAVMSICTAMSEGRLTPDEASNFIVVLDHSMQAIELHDIIRRIAALEAARDRRDEKSYPPAA